MSLESELAQTLDEIAASRTGNDLSWKDIIPLIDLTLLDSNATSKDICDLAIKAERHQVAAVCVLPAHLGYISPEIHIKRATVINFPSGNEPHQQVLQALEATEATTQVDEIDYVFPYQVYLAGNEQVALSCCQEAFQLSKQHGLGFKVILETGALPSMDVIYDLSMQIIEGGCDFLKTSTGKIPVGATIPAAFAMLSAIVDSHSNCGIKISGGVKTVEQAFSYMQLARYMLNHKLDSTCFRLGTSTLLDVLIKTTL